jgi:AcrR family transcriptional regulator
MTEQTIASRPAVARKGKRRGRPRKKDQNGAVATREKLLAAATKVFAERGLSGGRVNLISRAARSNDRMIYYYFGSKERLFVEVLEKVYRDMWEAESALALDQADPIEALEKFVSFTLDHYLTHPEMLTILNNENLLQGKHIMKSKKLKELSSPALDLMERIYRRGVEQGVFRTGVKPLELYLSVLALNYFYVSNRYTLSAFLGVDLAGESLKSWRRWAADAIVRAVRA